ncbi:MAG: TonB-dependent receptor [Prevotellaceae bacterium]|jgi:TonB-linked SusC/RagA family outer membrane protein|nr:TonB-dependent receptor [Prevotellaceae bacterium]
MMKKKNKTSMSRLRQWKTIVAGCMLLTFGLPETVRSETVNGTVNGMQQTKGNTITGIVLDENGEPVPGATIIVKGTTRGVITDMDGTFAIQATPENLLEISYLGYQKLTVTVGEQTRINVTLAPNVNELDEVTVVAFGMQKKESVVASITTVNPAELKVPSSNLTTAFAGNMAGIIAYQRSGEPGRDNADFFVRGITTFGNNNNPLILIDGIELTTTDLANLQPDDIASFSIMKDATATALYGARGANGVILVTTKQGAVGPAKISLRIENSVSAPTRNVEFADPVTFMRLSNESVLTRDPLATLDYSQEKIDNTAAGRNPLIYPANDWRSLLFKDYTMNQRVNLSVSGGGGVARYYVAGSFSKDNGILNVDKRNNFNNNIDLKKYSLRANVNIDITNSTELIVRLSGNFDEYTGPPDPNTDNNTPVGTEIYNMMVRSNPVRFPAYFPIDEDHQYVKHIMFGNYGTMQTLYRNPYAEMVRGYMNDSRSQMLAQLELKQNLDFITEGLNIRTLLNISRTGSFSVSRKYDPFWYQVESYDRITDKYRLVRLNPDSGFGAGTEYLDLAESPKSLESSLYSETVLSYAREFADRHALGGVLVLTAREHLTANAGSLQLSLPSRNAGLSGRATYSFDSRYFTEFNFGYNGSERFAANHRYGFFPSAGVAWNIANEAFWEPFKETVSNLKLRYSYGLVGNDRIGDRNDRFFYLSQVNMTDGAKAAIFGREIINLSGATGITVSKYANDEITWERSTKQNYALEVSLWNKLDIIAEYFTEYRNNILMTREFIPSTMGLSAAVRANVGESSGQGVDISMDYQQSWNKDFWTAARANFTYATSRYEVFEEPDYDEPWRSRVGLSLKQNYGYIAERLFMDDAEAYNSASQNFGVATMGGDIKYTDVNRDGQITPADMVPIGNPTVPEMVFGFGFSFGYKGFDASCFFQGAANESFWISTVDNPNAGTISTAPFQNQTQLLKVYADSHWSEDNQDMYATWPRLSSTLHLGNVQPSTWFMRDGSFVRLKQAEIGYTVPGKWQEKLHMGNFRVYVSGTNLLLFSKFKLWDAEMAGNGLGYPIQRVFNVGLNFSFN